VAEGKRRSKLSFPSSQLLILFPIKFHVTYLLDIQGLCDLGRKGCAAVESPIPLENTGASKLSLSFKNPPTLEDERKRPNCYSTCCYTYYNRYLGKTVIATV